MKEKILAPFLWRRGLILFALLLVAYFFIGYSLISYTPITGDEIAHLSAGQGITQGYDMNLEHPPLLKALDSIILKANFNFTSNDTGQWNRSITFLNSNKFDSAKIILYARSVYLVFNSILIIWLIIYTCIFKLIDPKFSLLFGILYVFSPSFFSHNYFITFDVAGAITALMSILALVILHLNFKNFNNKQVALHVGLVVFSLFLALNSKFSNFILLPIFVGYILAVIIYSLFKKNYRLLKSVSIYSFVTIVFTAILTWSLYALSYTTDTIAKAQGAKTNINDSIPQNPITRPFLRLVDGLLATSGRSNDSFANFVDSHLVILKYHDFINRVFWYKENPILFIFLAIAVLGLVWGVIKFLKDGGEQGSTSLFSKKSFNSLVEIALVSLFPIIYLATSWNSKLTIGYRHFYPVLIFTYFGIAWLVYKALLSKPKTLHWIITFLVTSAYIICGIIAIPQSLTYVNPLWNKPKWRLSTDSTISWAENEAWALKYLKDNNLLQKSVDSKGEVKWNTKMDVRFAAAHPFFVKSVIDPKENVYKTADLLKTDLTLTKISDLDVEYLAVDIYTFQKLSNKLSNSDKAKRDPDNIFQPNFDYLMDHKPIFQQNDVVFIYKLK